MKEHRIELILDVEVSSAEHADFIARELLRAASARFPGNIRDSDLRLYDENMDEVFGGTT